MLLVTYCSSDVHPIDIDPKTLFLSFLHILRFCSILSPLTSSYRSTVINNEYNSFCQLLGQQCASAFLVAVADSQIRCIIDRLNVL